jgi:hypothetical protein
MNITSKNHEMVIRPVQYRDLEALALLATNNCNSQQEAENLVQQLINIRPWYPLFKFLSLFPHPLRHEFDVFIAEYQEQLRGLIQVSPFNSTRSTWKVERILVNNNVSLETILTGKKGVGTQLLRYCLEHIWEARTWVLEVNINDEKSLAIYRENGFQPLAQMTYWQLDRDLLNKLAETEPDLPNLLNVSNADANLLYQLDCVSMPPLLRQVFDRHLNDFKTSFLVGLINKLKHWFGKKETVKGYVFEPQRKAAIGYYELELCKDGSSAHKAQLIVHPAYTWLYPKLVCQMAQTVKNYPAQRLELASADYQPEREEYLTKIGAYPLENTLLMSRSVWHKIREIKPLEALQLSEVLQGLQPVRTPIPSRFDWLTNSAYLKHLLQEKTQSKNNTSAKKDDHNLTDFEEQN